MIFDASFEEMNRGFAAEVQQVVCGDNGKSAYEIAVGNGFVGTQEQWLESLKGVDGQDGYTPVRGVDYWTESDKEEIVADVIAALPVYNGEVV